MEKSVLAAVTGHIMYVQHSNPFDCQSELSKMSWELTSEVELPSLFSSATKLLMKLAVFDLDYTLWRPEMYQLNGPPHLTPIEKVKTRKLKLSPAMLKEARTNLEDHVLVDRRGNLMRVFDGANYALEDIKRMQTDGHPIQAAAASRTDEPSWARICMQHLALNDGTVLAEVFGDLVEISGGSKVKHLQRLSHKTGIRFEDMCFFDNEQWNIEDVSRSLPVKCYYTPNGMTRQAWKDALKDSALE